MCITWIAISLIITGLWMFRSVIFQGEHVSLQPWYCNPHFLVNMHLDTGMLYLSNRFRADSWFFTFFQGVDFVVDGGERLAYPSTVVDMTGQKPTLLRRGKVQWLNSWNLLDWLVNKMLGSLGASVTWILQSLFCDLNCLKGHWLSL